MTNSKKKTGAKKKAGASGILTTAASLAVPLLILWSLLTAQMQVFLHSQLAMTLGAKGLAEATPTSLQNTFLGSVSISLPFGVLALIVLTILVFIWVWLYSSIGRGLQDKTRDCLDLVNVVILLCCLLAAIVFSSSASVLLAMSAAAVNMAWWLIAFASFGVLIVYLIPSLLLAFGNIVLLSAFAVIVAFGWDLLNPGQG